VTVCFFHTDASDYACIMMLRRKLFASPKGKLKRGSHFHVIVFEGSPRQTICICAYIMFKLFHYASFEKIHFVQLVNVIC